MEGLDKRAAGMGGSRSIMGDFLDTLMTPREEDPYLWNSPMNAPVVYERRRQLEAAKKSYQRD